MIRKRIDPVIFFVSLGLVAFGVVMVVQREPHSGAGTGTAMRSYFVETPCYMGPCLGFACMLVISQMDHQYLRKIAYPLLIRLG